MAWSQIISLITRNVGLMHLRCFERPPHGPKFLSISLNGTQVGIRKDHRDMPAFPGRPHLMPGNRP